MVKEIQRQGGIEGLKDSAKTGRPPELSDEISYKIKTILKENNQGWTTKHVKEVIVKERKGGIKYHHAHICHILCKWGFRQKVPRKVHVSTASKEEKEDFKKRTEQIFVDKIREEKGVTVVSLNESFFFYDSLVRRVWIEDGKSSIVRVTGSHKHSCIFGAIILDGKQLFRQYKNFNGDAYLEYLQIINSKFPRCYLFLDNASPHYKSRKIIKYFEQNKMPLFQYIFQQYLLDLW